MLMVGVKTLMGITEDFKGVMSVTQKLDQRPFPELLRLWPHNGDKNNSSEGGGK